MKMPPAKMPALPATGDYPGLVGNIGELLESARRTSASAVNTLMTATYWEVGRRIVEFEQGGAARAEYGETLLLNLARDLTGRFGRGFGKSNLFLMRKFFLTTTSIFQTLSGKSGEGASPAQIFQTPSGISVQEKARSSSSGIQTDRANLARAFPLPWSHYVLLVSNSRSPEALDFYHTEALRGGWTVRQLRRQMHLYLNYAAEHWTQPGENPPVGMIRCSGKGAALVRYATENLPNKVLVRDYLTALPDESTLAAEISSARRKLEARNP